MEINTNIDLNVDLNNLDLSFPVMAPGKLQLEIGSAELKPTVSGGSRINLKFTNVREVPAEDGSIIPAKGSTFFFNVNLTPSGKMTAAMVLRNVGSLIQAVGGLPGARVTNAEQWVDSLPGKTCLAQVKVKPESTDKNTGKTYARSNDIGYFVIPKG